MSKKRSRGAEPLSMPALRISKLARAVQQTLIFRGARRCLNGGIVIATTCGLVGPLQAVAQDLELIDLANLNGVDGFVIDATPGGQQALSAAGDMNGDGLGDIVIGNDRNNVSYVFFGQRAIAATRSALDLDGSNGFVIQGTDTPGNLGIGENVGGGGDVNGDGFDDVVLGARIFYAEGSLRGAQSYVVFGPGKHVSGSSIQISDLDGQSGFEVRGVPTSFVPISSGANVIGDVNDDGTEDFIVGNFSGSPDSIDTAGRAFVVFGRENVPFPPTLSLSDLNGENGFAIYGEQTTGLLGVGTTGLGDVNGDGIDDFAVGAPDVGRNNSGAERGETYVIFGRDVSQGPAFPPVTRPGDLDGKNGFVIRGAVNSRLGFSLGNVGDINGDDISDIIAGAYTSSRSYVVFGRNTSEVGEFPPLIAVSDLDGTNGFELISQDQFGWSVDGAGDFNGDGINDAIIGAPEYGNFGLSLILFGRDASVGSTFPGSMDISTLDSNEGVLLRGAAFPGRPRGGNAGFAVTGLGDINGDSLDDVAVGDEDFGGTYVVFGRREETTLLIRCLGDIDGDGQQDLAALVQEATSGPIARIKGMSSAPVRTVEFDSKLNTADMEVMADINGNEAPELVVLGRGSVKAEVRDSLTGELLGTVSFDPNLSPVDLELVPDQSGNAVPEVASLGEGSVSVEVKDPVTTDPVNTVNFAANFMPKDLSVFDLAGAIKLGVLSENKDPARGDKVEVRDLATGTLLKNLWYGKGWNMKQLELLSDVNGNQAPEAAVLRVHPDDRVSVLVKDAKNGTKISKLGFDAKYPPIKMAIVPDLNGNNSDEVVVLGRHRGGFNQKAWVKDGKTNQTIKQVFFNKAFIPKDMDVCPDIDGNGSDELVMLGRRESDGKLRAIIRDAKTGELIKAFNF